MNEHSIHLLIVDDDPDIRDLLAHYLQSYGMQCLCVGNGQAMRDALAHTSFDLIILDLMLPGEDGLSLCRHVRSVGDTPIIMLTARGESADRVVGLELGADDYVVKPFDPRELVARIHTILRRARGSSTPGEQDTVQFAGWRLSHLKREITTPAQLVVPLSNAEYRLLCAFLERPQRILSREQLMDAARGRTVEAFDRSIDLLVSRLRQKLGDDPKQPQLLKTVRGEGYLLDSKVG
ncbi:MULTISPECIES: response regulator [Vogesella]|jgi:two-component system OmpR family response regulator|uniref:response regulator n=1 Tax=Vogesella TaxID=57739 RepID=UPI00197FF7B1|nr:response regulator [Vogesella urethralis]MEC5208526.1 two-component system OmpR family response regulator [Vogesella perlucida]